MAAKKTLFDLVVEPARLHPRFEHLRTFPGDASARWMLDDVYQSFVNPEGNFLEQFQTTGFDARFFELYVFAYFSRSGFLVERHHPNPDFLVSRDGLQVAVEATTVNPSTSGVLAKCGRKLSELTMEERREYARNELPIRFGSPLFSKLQKEYWQLEHCRGLPFVIASEAFCDDESLTFTDHALARYLFGLEQTGMWTAGGKLEIVAEKVSHHSVGDKVIPSDFFMQPGAENVSAAMFTNSGTHAKFFRMGYQYGVGCDSVDVGRTGLCFNPERDAKDPTLFSYNLDEPPIVESWGQGLVIVHNARAVRPVPREFFVDAAEGYLDGETLRFDHQAWHPIASRTLIVYLGDLKKQLAEKLPARMPRMAIAAIPKAEFQARWGFATRDEHPVIRGGRAVLDKESGCVNTTVSENSEGRMNAGRRSRA